MCFVHVWVSLWARKYACVYIAALSLSVCVCAYIVIWLSSYLDQRTHTTVYQCARAHSLIQTKHNECVLVWSKHGTCLFHRVKTVLIVSHIAHCCCLCYSTNWKHTLYSTNTYTAATQYYYTILRSEKRFYFSFCILHVSVYRSTTKLSPIPMRLRESEANGRHMWNEKKTTFKTLACFSKHS